jgi:O-antigen/teichoic acid export membrane protein
MGAKQFFKGLSWLLVLNLLVKPAWIFLIDRRVQNIVGHEAYGSYFALYNLTYVLLFVADAGLSNMLAQRLAAEKTLNVRQLLRLKIFLLLLYVAVCVSFALLTGVAHRVILGYLVLIQALTSLFIFLRGLLTARQFYKPDAVFSVLDKTLLLALCIGPVYGFFRPMTITLFLQLQSLSTTVAVLSLLFFLVRKKSFPQGEKLTYKTIASWTAPFVLIILLMSAHNRLDAFLLERMHVNGAVQAGIYATAFRLLDAGNVAGFLTASFLVPFLSRHRNDNGLVQQVLLLSRHGLLLVAVSVVAFVLVFAPWLQQVLYHSGDVYSVSVMRLCLAALPAYYLTHVYGSALTAAGQFRAFILVLFFAVLLNVLLNLWLIPNYGARGCCLAALASQYGCGLALWLIASRRLAVSVSAGSMALYAAIALLLLFLFYGAQRLTGNVWIILSSIAFLATVFLLTQRSTIKRLFLPFYK